MSKKNAVLYMYKTGFGYFEQDMKAILSYSFPQNIVSDFEIINRDLFEEAIVKFFQQNKIPASMITIVFAPNTLFSQKFSILPKADIENDQNVKKFLENVPFEHVGYLAIPQAKDVTVYATNEDFCIFIKHALEKALFSIETVSLYAVGGFISSTETGFTIEIANKILQKIADFRQHNLLTPRIAQKEEAPISAQINPNKKIKSKRPLVLIAVFAILLVVLGFMLWNTLKPTPSANKPKIIPPLNHTIVTPSATAAESTASPSANLH